ncbi:MAG: hypothetical protein L6R41_000405 [Letrouitia leprolyta]|nr:MAG: hypothetical protein L6R41_000405 [Letrouitia leprolyta]
MYHWAGVNIYEEETPTAEGHSAIIHGLQISYQNIPEGPIKIHWKHVILSILTALDSMDKTNTFAETIVEMKQDEKIFGTMRVGNPQTDRVIEASGETNAATAKRDHSKSVAIHRNRAATDPNTHTSKTIIDPDTPEIGAMNITYQRFGNAVDCKLLFSTALDGIAYAAADDNGDTWPYSTCYNWSKKMMYQTVQVKIGDGGSRWTADLIKRVARLLPQRLFEEGQCGEVRFRVEIEGTGRVGTGSF